MRTLVAHAGTKYWPVAGLLLVFVLFTVPHFVRSLDAADGLEPSWNSSLIWVESSDCARATGAFLAICQGDRVIPIADVSAGDDPGQPLALDIYSILTGNAASLADVSKLNSTINYIGLVLLAMLLFTLRLPFLSLLILTFGVVISDRFQSTGPHPGHFGVACLVTLLPLAVLGMPLAHVSRRVFRSWVVVGIAALAVAMLFREAIGFMGVVCSLLATGLSYFLSNPKSRRSALVHAGLAFVIVLTVWTPYSILRLRDAIYHTSPSARMEQHGTWHNLYIGLGAVENPFGIVWIDSYAIEAVKKIDPSVPYLSNAYFVILRREYFQMVLQHPVEVAAIYFKKLVIALKNYHMWLQISIVAALFLFARRKLRAESPGWGGDDSVLAICAVFIAAFLGQAVLFHYTELYLFPVKLFLLLGAGVTFETVVRLVAVSIRRPKLQDA